MSAPAVVSCTSCARLTPANRTGTKFPGCPTYRCQHCAAEFAYPATTANLVVMYVLGLGAAIAAVKIIAAGGLPIPGLLGLLVAWGIYRDLSIRRQVKDAVARSHRDGEAPSG